MLLTATAEKYRFHTVRHVLEYYMENHGFTVESWDDLAHMTNVFISVMGGKRIKDLGPEHFNAYTSGRRRGVFGKRKAKSSGTLRRELIHLRTAINFCAKAKLIDPDSVPFIPLPESPPPRDRWLSKEEVRAMKAATIPWSRGEMFMRIVTVQPYRRKAIETLEWPQINFTTGMIDPMKPGEKKTNKRKPMLPFTTEQRHYFEEYKYRQDREAPSRFVLGHAGSIFEAVEAIARRAGVEGVTPHVMRHTWATHAVMDGVPMEEVARVLGDSIVTVEKVYAKYKPDYLKGAIERASL